MNFKAFYDKIVDLIYGNRRNIMRVSFSALALLLLIIVLFFSSDNFNINSEVDTLIKYIDGRQYTMAETYFDDIEKEFSEFEYKVGKAEYIKYVLGHLAARDLFTLCSLSADEVHEENSCGGHGGGTD